MRSFLPLLVFLSVIARLAAAHSRDGADDGTITLPLVRAELTRRNDSQPLEVIAAQVQIVAAKYKQRIAAKHRNARIHSANARDDSVGLLAGEAGETDTKRRRSRRRLDQQKQRRSTSGTLALTPDASYALWRGAISIGTPAQKVEVSLDTGSADLVLNTGQYSAASSTSAKYTGKAFTIDYADSTGESGRIYNETVKLAGKTARHQAVGVPSTSTFDSTDPGLIGMAFQSVSVFGRRPLVQTLAAEGAIPRAMAGVALARRAANAEVRIGGYNPAKIKSGHSLAWNAVDSSQGFWIVDDAEVIVKRGAKSGAVARRSLILDTGTTYIYGSVKDVSKLYAALGIRTVESDGFVTGVFRALPSVTFTLGGSTYALKQHAVVADEDAATGLKYGAIIGCDDLGLSAGQWLVGDGFFQSVYAVFDFDRARVGLAPANF